jgi:hypothetical protein
MGTLDDAIRAHLELKRRKGASDEEIERQEQEAFGRGQALPSRLDPPPEGSAPQPAPPSSEAVEEPSQSSPEPAEPNGAGPEQSVVEEGLRERDEVLPEEALEPAPPESPSGPSPEPTMPELAPPSHEPPVPVPPPVTERSASRGEVVEPAEDLLEETPDFLEETPEHDRLWFEQRPPKDFEFD